MSKKFLINNRKLPVDDLMTLATNITEIVSIESCGYCTHCRVGCLKLLEGIKNLEKGEFSPSYINALIKLATCVKNRSQCYIGKEGGEAFMAIIKVYQEKFLTT